MHFAIAARTIPERSRGFMFDRFAINSHFAVTLLISARYDNESARILGHETRTY